MEFFPIEWRTNLKLDEGIHIFEITIHSNLRLKLIQKYEIVFNYTYVLFNYTLLLALFCCIVRKYSIFIIYPVSSLIFFRNNQQYHSQQFEQSTEHDQCNNHGCIVLCKSTVSGRGMYELCVDFQGFL